MADTTLTPSILNHLFKNSGVGPELNEDIVPAVHSSDADKLTKSVTISLTGDASGSVSFDGSKNVSIDTSVSRSDVAEKLSKAREIALTGDVTGSANFDGSGDIKISTSAAVGSAWSSRTPISVNTGYNPTADGYIIVSALTSNNPSWSDGVNVQLGTSSSNITITARMLFGTHYSLGGDTCVYPVKSGMYFYMGSRGNAGGSYAYFIPK